MSDLGHKIMGREQKMKDVKGNKDYTLKVVSLYKNKEKRKVY